MINHIEKEEILPHQSEVGGTDEAHEWKQETFEKLHRDLECVKRTGRAVESQLMTENF